MLGTIIGAARSLVIPGIAIVIGVVFLISYWLEKTDEFYDRKDKRK